MTLSIMPLQFTTRVFGYSIVEYPKTVMSDYRAIAVDISFELIPILFGSLDVPYKDKHISSDKLSSIYLLDELIASMTKYELIASVTRYYY